jgi:hypothetical protein
MSTSTDISALYREFTEALTEVLAEKDIALLLLRPMTEDEDRECARDGLARAAPPPGAA